MRSTHIQLLWTIILIAIQLSHYRLFLGQGPSLPSTASSDTSTVGQQRELLYSLMIIEFYILSRIFII